MKLTGHDASVLAFIARYPASSEAAALITNLSSPVREIAEAIVRPGSPSNWEHTAAAIRKWAEP